MSLRQVYQRPAAELIGCADCGLVQLLPPVPADALAECVRCKRAFAPPARGSIDTALALTVTAVLLLLPAALLPLMRLSSFGVQRRNWLPTGVEALWNDGYVSLSAVVFVFSIAIPFAYLGLMTWVLAGIRLGPEASLGKLFRWTAALRPWVMIEVYLVGCCVAYTRLESVGTVEVGAGGWCLLAATLAAVLASLKLDEQSVWDALPPRNSLNAPKQPISCETCELMIDVALEHSACPRCGARIRRRKPDAMGRTLALVITGYLLYVPANLLPVLSIERFGRDDPSTIVGGVHELITSGLWPLAVIVFTASVVVPLIKLFGLTLMLVMTRRRSRRWLVGRTRMYRFIDRIGRWSNIDVFMISILAALLQFGTLTSLRPQPGAIAFAAVVVITMLASRCFDARVMWDASGSAA
ncbi:MAG TPA: paraquat-inducible protein A [Steroidobacteraceae bacterium]